MQKPIDSSREGAYFTRVRMLDVRNGKVEYLATGYGRRPPTVCSCFALLSPRGVSFFVSGHVRRDETKTVSGACLYGHRIPSVQYRVLLGMKILEYCTERNCTIYIQYSIVPVVATPPKWLTGFHAKALRVRNQVVLLGTGQKPQPARTQEATTKWL